ncbi:MAG: PilW family protein [Pirellulales bacterium]
MNACSSRARGQRGFSLVELMVGVAIGLVVTLAIFQVLVASEGRKRSVTGVNDVSQSGAYSIYAVDRMLRSAGTGFAEGMDRVGGCRLNARLPLATGESLPRVNAFPAPFTAMPRFQRLAPVLIFPGASDTGSDVIMVMSGASGYGEVLATVQPGTITGADLQLTNTIGYRAGDLVMIAGGGECLLSQVNVAKPACAGDPAAAPNTVCGPQLPLSGTYFTDVAAHTSLATLNGISGVSTFTLGNPALGNPPWFLLLGVGANSTLFAHDLLLTTGVNVSEPIAEGVHDMRALYGIDTNNDGVLDAWQSPTVASGWDGETLMNGTPVSTSRLRQIVAVRVGLVMRSALVEREIEPGVPVAPASLRLFGDLPAANQVTIDLTQPGQNRNQRHRTIEITVPLRNILMLSTS